MIDVFANQSPGVVELTLLGWILLSVLVLATSLLVTRSSMFLLMYFGQWFKGGRPKVFPRPRECPRCGQPVGRFERINSIAKVLLGGWACPRCGSEFDQLNNTRIARAWNANLRDLEERSALEAKESRREDSRSPVQRMLDE
jgi:ribosomal protein S27AE